MCKFLFTTDCFLCSDYNNTTDLHIAVTTSNGCIVEFDRQGLRRHRTDRLGEWGQCLFVNDVPEAWYDYWDEVLIQVTVSCISFLSLLIRSKLARIRIKI